MKFSAISQNNNSLYPHQIEAKSNILSAWDSYDSIMLQMPTGTGKTYLFTSLLKDILIHYDTIASDVKILIIAHRTELIEQISRSLTKYGIGHGIIQGSTPQKLAARVQVASIQSIFSCKNEDYIKKTHFDYIIIDEAHHSLAETYQRLFKAYPDSKKLGVTATPCRLKKESFGKLFEKLITTPQVSKFIKDGRLADFQYISVLPDSYVVNLTKTIKVASTGDYVNRELDSAFNVGSIRSRLFDSYVKFAKGKKGIIYAINKVHAANIAKLYSSHGVVAEAIDCDTPKTERERLIGLFKSGSIKVLVNVEIFTEGFDCPDVSFIQLARPTKSLSLYLQQVGRGLRISPNKESAVIIDNVGLYYTFGLPDADRDWDFLFHGKEYIFHDSRILEAVPLRNQPCLIEGDEEMVEIKDRSGNLMEAIDASISKSYKFVDTDGSRSWQSESDMRSEYSYRGIDHLTYPEFILTIIREVVNRDVSVKKRFFTIIGESNNRVRINPNRVTPILMTIDKIIEAGKEKSFYLLDCDRIVDESGCEWAITKDIPESIVNFLLSRCIRKHDYNEKVRLFYHDQSTVNHVWNISDDNAIKLLAMYREGKTIREIASVFEQPERFVRSLLLDMKIYTTPENSIETLVDKKITEINKKREERIAAQNQKKEKDLDNHIESLLSIPDSLKKTLIYPYPTTYPKYKVIMDNFVETGTIQMLVLMYVIIRMIEEKTIAHSTLPYSNKMAIEFKKYWSQFFGTSRNSECKWTEAFCKLSKESFCTMTLSSGSKVQYNPTSLLNHGASIRFCSDMDRLFSYGKFLIEIKQSILLKLLPKHKDRILKLSNLY